MRADGCDRRRRCRSKARQGGYAVYRAVYSVKNDTEERRAGCALIPTLTTRRANWVDRVAPAHEDLMGGLTSATDAWRTFNGISWLWLLGVASWRGLRYQVGDRNFHLHYQSTRMPLALEFSFKVIHNNLAS